MKISRTVWIVSFVSLFTDIASEMLYPVMPIYLKTIGFSALLIGLLEGFAEATAGLSKGYFGNMSDRKGSRVPFVRFGYFLSSLSKPMLAVFSFPLWVFGARTVDRLGKGIRTSARDAILSAEATPETKGRIFGLHRAMDTAGAMIGPVCALALIWIFHDNFRLIFLIAFIPGIFAVLLNFLIKEKKITSVPSITSKGFFAFLKYWKVASKDYKKLVIGLLFFSLINSSDIFLLLLIKFIGYSDIEVIAVYIFYNFIYALTSYPVGIFADKLGLKKVFCIGLILFAVVYGGMAFQPPLYVIFILFFVYGIYASSTESISKAWISNIVNKRDTATAIGFYTGLGSIFTLFASIFAGFLWSTFNPSVMFAFSFSGAIILILYFLKFIKCEYNTL
ncbi:MAG: MFS transporter [Ignavibacteriae bacterium]|nr:MFS transporter [Ignavibacteriota bacterium]